MLSSFKRLFSFTVGAGLIVSSCAALAGQPYVGLGVTITEGQNKTIVFEDVFDGGPASTAGILVGETLKAVNSKAVQGLGVAAVSNLMQGAVGTHVQLTVTSLAGQDRNLDLVLAMVSSPCIIEGSISLQTNGFGGNPPTSISGEVGGSFVNWMISGSSVYATIGGQTYFLTYSVLGTEQEITGFIDSTYIDWTGSNGFISGYQACVQ